MRQRVLPFQLDPGEATGGGLLRLLRAEVRAALAAAVGPGTLAPGERVHKARTGAKKVRAVLQLFRSSSPRFYKRWNRYFRESARQLSALRDADVLLETFDSLLGGKSARGSRRLGAVRAHLVSRRRKLGGDAPTTRAALSEFAGKMRAALQEFSQRRPKGDGFSAIKDDLRRAYRRSRRACRRAWRTGADPDIHSLRKATKALGYHHGFLRMAWPPVMKGIRHSFDDLTDLLGTYHDLSVLCAAVGEGAGARVVARVARAAQREALAKARLAAELLLRPKPRAWIGRIEHQWRIASAMARAAPAGTRGLGA